MTLHALIGFFSDPFRTDFHGFYSDGLAWRLHRPLYRPNPTFNLNPPTLIAWVFAPLSLLSLRVAQITWVTVNVCSGTLAFRRLSRELALAPERIVLIAGMLLLTHGTFQQFALGQFVGALTMCLTFAWSAYRHGRYVASGLWLAPAIAVKPPLALVALCLPWSVVVTAGAVSTAITLATVIATGLEPWRTWIALGEAIYWVQRPLNASLWGLAARWSHPETWVRMTDITLPWTVAVLLASFALWGHARRQQDRDRRFLCAALLSILVSPLGWGYYFPLIVGPLVAAWPRSWLAWTAYASALLPLGSFAHAHPLLGSANFAAAVGTWIAATRRPPAD